MAGELIMTVVGNVTADPESRTVGDKTVVSFTVAQQTRTFDRETNAFVDGPATFIRCSAWRELADHIVASVSKGTRVIAQGRFSQRSYETREGEKRTSYELEVDEIGPSLRFATATVERQGSNRNQQQRRDQGGYGAPAHQAQPRTQTTERTHEQQAWGAGGYDDETPF